MMGRDYWISFTGILASLGILWVETARERGPSLPSIILAGVGGLMALRWWLRVREHEGFGKPKSKEPPHA